MENINENEIVVSNKMIRKDMNHVGRAFLFSLFLQVYVPFLLIAFFGLVYTVPNVSEETAKTLETLMILITLVVSESAPFIICAQRLKFKSKTLFAKPTMSFKHILLLSVVTMGVSVFISQIVGLIQLLLNEVGIVMTTPDFALNGTFLYNALMIIMVVVVAPIFEEFMLRGVALKALSKYGTSFAIITTALLFALLHGNFIQGIPAFFMGIIFGVITVKAKSIIPTIIIHFINNSTAMLEEFIEPYFPSFGLIITILLVLGAIYLIIKNKHLIKMPKDTKNHPSAWLCFFTSYSMIIVMIVYIALFLFSLIPATPYPVL